MVRPFITLLLLIVPSVSLAADAATQPAHTLVLHLNGIGGERSIDHSLIRGLMQGGIDADFRIYDWTGKESGMLALTDVKLHETQAAKVSQMIVDYRQQHPDDRIIVTSHSGGAGIAAWALAQLPKDVNIDTWVMLEPALSPKFDLSDALSHVTGKAYAFTSMNDLIVLGAGTQLMGTIDRVKCDAAGRVGFKRPSTASAAEYEKLVPVPYESAWLRYGNIGDHIGPLMRPFAKKIIAPTLLDGVVPITPPLFATSRPTGTP
jgi:pimeloyl-ACP methyl ester carboxylesterase